MQSYRGEQIVWHFGLVPDAYSSLILKVPARRLTLILLANSDGLSGPFSLQKGDVTSSLFAKTFLRLFLWHARRASHSCVFWPESRRHPPPALSRRLVRHAVSRLKFAGDTKFVDLDKARATPSSPTAAAAGLLDEGLFGVEADFGYSPRFFERSSGSLVARSNV